MEITKYKTALKKKKQTKKKHNNNITDRYWIDSETVKHTGSEQELSNKKEFSDKRKKLQKTRYFGSLPIRCNMKILRKNIK